MKKESRQGESQGSDSPCEGSGDSERKGERQRQKSWGPGWRLDNWRSLPKGLIRN